MTGENGAGDDSTQKEESAGEERRDFKGLEESLGYTFSSAEIVERALTHRSMLGKGSRSDYERLEFLGDAVLDLAVAQLLLDAYPDAKEGELSKMRAALVNTSSLAEIGKGINVGPFIRLSRGELASGGAERQSILADVVEALIGAIFRDSGYNAAFLSIRKLFQLKLASVTPRDPKTELQEALHVKGLDAPEYLLEYVEGPEHSPCFVSVVKIGEEIVGRGSGATKKASQQAAAAEALLWIEKTKK